MHHQRIWSCWKHCRRQLKDSRTNGRVARGKNERERRHRSAIGRHVVSGKNKWGGKRQLEVRNGEVGNREVGKGAWDNKTGSG